MNLLRRVGKAIRAAGAEFVTIPNVPIIATGIEYPLANGPVTFTEDDLRDAVRAAEEDTNIQHPRLKLAYGGPHTDDVINEPSFGTVTNLRLGDNDQTIYGDLTGIPAWLAPILPVAYPSRSIEGNFNCETVGGNKYRLVINNVSLLGVHLPGVTSLPDLAGYYGADVPAGAVIDSPIQASVAVDDIRRQYYEELDAAGPDYAWWWIRAMDLEAQGGYLVVDNDEGDLFKVQFIVAGEEVTFEDPKQVKIVYEDAPKEQMAASVVASMADIRPDQMTVYATRAESRPTTTKKGGSDLDLKALAKRVGLSEDASEDEVNARLDVLAEAEPAEEETTEEETTEETTETEEETETEEPATAPAEPATDAEGFVRLDKETYERLAANSKEAAELVASSKKERREAVVMSAIKAGKIVPASKQRFLQLYEADPDGTEKLLTAEADKGGLAPGLVPVNETGSGGDNETDVEGLPETWFGGAVAASRKRAETTSRVTMAREA